MRLRTEMFDKRVALGGRESFFIHAIAESKKLECSAPKNVFMETEIIISRSIYQPNTFFLCRARRIQNMGYTPSSSLWLSLRGGDVYFNNEGTSDNFDQVKLGSRGFGILDIGYVISPNTSPKFCITFYFKSTIKSAMYQYIITTIVYPVRVQIWCMYIASAWNCRIWDNCVFQTPFSFLSIKLCMIILHRDKQMCVVCCIAVCPFSPFSCASVA